MTSNKRRESASEKKTYAWATRQQLPPSWMVNDNKISLNFFLKWKHKSALWLHLTERNEKAQTRNNCHNNKNNECLRAFFSKTNVIRVHEQDCTRNSNKRQADEERISWGLQLKPRFFVFFHITCTITHSTAYSRLYHRNEHIFTQEMKVQQRKVYEKTTVTTISVPLHRTEQRPPKPSACPPPVQQRGRQGKKKPEIHVELLMSSRTLLLSELQFSLTACFNTQFCNATYRTRQILVPCDSSSFFFNKSARCWVLSPCQTGMHVACTCQKTRDVTQPTARAKRR